MRKTAGFTLIELVIVIVILGILGAVAAPRFINLQGDAYEANINALKGSLQSAVTLANTRAILDGKEEADGTSEVVTGFDGVAFLAGYPKAEVNNTGILGTLQDFDLAAYDVTVIDAAADGSTARGIRIRPENRKAVTCEVVYYEAQKAAAQNGATPAKPALLPKISADISSCDN
ncbi:pilus assembly FimT family protein [Oceanisphaera sp. KMM 10153]|uniref:pilus assembly FimT family protein n=1 Tax=Oceanisphaera submarina TaxID=3390193 RepID=UPI0039754150